MSRLGHLAAIVLFCASLGNIGAPARAASYGYNQAANSFENDFGVDQRILTQILLIAAGYTNAVPMEHFSRRTFEAVQSFQADNGFAVNGRLDRGQVDRLVAAGGEKLNLWGFRKMSYPDRSLAIWAPMGLGLNVTQNASGLHFKDDQGRLELDMVSLPNKFVFGVYNGLLADKKNAGASIHYAVFKDNEEWFVISTTMPDGTDHYYRYHQDGSYVTGFALEWNNANGNINAERIAVIMSGSLRSAMTGAPFIDPPAASPPQAPVQTAAVPVAPVPIPPPKTMVSTGTGFFVSDAGHFVTNAHVVNGCSKILVKADDGSVNSAERIATDDSNDLALLKLAKTPARIAALRIGGRLGEGVEAFGFPHSDVLSSSGNFTLGNITAMSGLHDDSRYLQISAPVQSGNSGGPLLDSTGNLVGVVSAKLDAVKIAMADGDLTQNVNFAVKSAMVAAFLDANRVTYKVGAPGGTAMAPADIADQARAMSGFVACQ